MADKTRTDGQSVILTSGQFLCQTTSVPSITPSIPAATIPSTSIPSISQASLNTDVPQQIVEIITPHHTLTPLHCWTCVRKFASKSSLNRHLRQVHNPFEDQMKYQCGLCEVSYIRKGDYVKHFLNKHKNRTLQEPVLISAKDPAAKRQYSFQDNATPKKRVSGLSDMTSYIQEMTKPKTHLPTHSTAISTAQPVIQTPAAPTTLKSPSSPDVNLPDDEELEYQHFIDQKFQDLFDLAGNNRDLGAEHELNAEAEVEASAEAEAEADYLDVPTAHSYNFIVNLQH